MNDGETTSDRWPGPWLLCAGVLMVPIVVMVLIGTVVTLAVRPDPNSFLAYCDPSDLQSLPTWWTAVVLGLAAVAASLKGRAAALDRRWWFAATGSLLLFSLCVFSSVHQRLDGLARQVLGSNPLTADWLPSAIAAWMVLAVPFVVLVRRGRTTSGAGLLAGLGVFGLGGLGEVLAARVFGSGAPDPADPGAGVPLPAAGVVVTNLAATVHMLAAACLLLLLLRDLPVRRDGARLRVAVRDRTPEAPSWFATDPTVPERRPVWRWLLVLTLVFGLLSLLVVLPFENPGQKLVGWVHFLDLDHENNFASWWSIGLLAGAALTQALAGWAALAAGDRSTARGWWVTAVLMAGFSLDDATSVHERLGDLIKPHTAVRSGDFPYFWLIPGAVVGLLVAVAFTLHALRLAGRTRLLLLGGLGLFLFCSMGLEAIEGWLIEQGVGRTVQVLGYHVEEVGENLGALLLVGAGTSALALVRRRRDLVLGLADGAPVLEGTVAVDDVTEAIPRVGAPHPAPSRARPLTPAHVLPGRLGFPDDPATTPIPRL